MVKAKRHRRTIQHKTPEVGTKLRGRYHEQDVFAEVVSRGRGKIGVSFNGVVYRSMSGAASAATGGSTDGWIFWKVIRKE
jgi:hypothetical protein